MKTPDRIKVIGKGQRNILIFLLNGQNTDLWKRKIALHKEEQSGLSEKKAPPYFLFEIF